MRATIGVGIALMWLLAPPVAQGQSATAANDQLAAALLPLPEHLRREASVVRLEANRPPEVLRKGTNGLTCIADRPNDSSFDVRCYHDQFIGVVLRQFSLALERVPGQEIMSRIEAEIKSGKLTLPPQPTAGYRCLGPLKGEGQLPTTPSNEIRCWQSIHFPYRTASEMGLMDEKEMPPALRPSMPYVMSSGTFWSHVMIEHPEGHNHEAR